ncbi:SDR family NAD(P)-dependent oxidoreductase [Tsukamurella sp. 8F]|uniref:SDR family NAD(P)-dependent oxidoreductase n=1 Tax=unclassified Tsukamurella TaxID=2633480 RepID=UPI0023B9E2C1|nr:MULTISPECIES: SDR family NAD(P)-dependent oxidoreductase [unclassified Tsukamurella]MDF0530868.1 SDR family NAD(P)-dependent oxidoreductase [Tsukamurella sp. 8J]MDF0588187.1 SDR family NAD(P)-dependent oxidoreductase [Tsukamurella sp. 8F]
MSKVWFVTGAGSGFGREIAEAAAARGDAVFATARDGASVAAFTHGCRLDVTDPEQVRQAVDAAMTEFGRIDVVVNNAGHGLLGAVEEVSDADLRGLLDVNLLGAWRVTRAVLPHLRRQGTGHIVQLSSVGGVVGNPGHAAYATTKFALEGMSEALAGEVAGWGVRVTVVEPGPFRTDFAGRSIAAAEPLAAYADSPAGELRRRFPLQHGRQPNDPVRAAAAILAVVDHPDPPLRLPLGPESVDRIRAKLRTQLDEIDAWEALAMDTRYA